MAFITISYMYIDQFNLQRMADRPGKYRTYNAHQSSIFTYERVAKAGFNPPFVDDRQYCRTLL